MESIKDGTEVVDPGRRSILKAAGMALILSLTGEEQVRIAGKVFKILGERFEDCKADMLEMHDSQVLEGLRNLLPAEKELFNNFRTIEAPKIMFTQALQLTDESLKDILKKVFPLGDYDPSKLIIDKNPEDGLSDFIIMYDGKEICNINVSGKDIIVHVTRNIHGEGIREILFYEIDDINRKINEVEYHLVQNVKTGEYNNGNSYVLSFIRKKGKNGPRQMHITRSYRRGRIIIYFVEKDGELVQTTDEEFYSFQK